MVSVSSTTGEQFSPHTRGCSRLTPHRRNNPTVFPAYAGMFLIPPTFAAYRDRFPRIRGDVPKPGAKSYKTLEFSPHTRGCSVQTFPKRRRNRVFPAYAGMFRGKNRRKSRRNGFPRIRGDVPLFQMLRKKSPRFSPHTRGCSSFKSLADISVTVFPAYAGMFLGLAQGPIL